MANEEKREATPPSSTDPKYHRPHFAVVGEGTKIAIDKYRLNYDLIDWSK